MLKTANGVILGTGLTALTAVPAFAQDAASATGAQTSLIASVTTWGAVGVAVIAAVMGFKIAYSMLKAGK